MKVQIIFITALLLLLNGCQPAGKIKKEKTGMKLGYTIIYVENVDTTVEFYEKAFGLKRRFVHESRQYAEMETGATVLAFTGDQLAAENVVKDFTKNQPDANPAAFEIAFTSDDVEADFAKAVNAGATVLKKPVVKPWGQTVGYVRDLNGVIVEIGSPASG